ncbi:hypothetical protein AKJ51_04375 [candidate division MSBL1 archaeon SCGC-AAA382A20]|uniref:Tyr recombinase domain-containing protein n=1 Tax=candidate division MSBL1 archaeon SCGC-AAA382A20 TaxID=1698280 RepID=A0A133VHS7_9EURY|nr:hypothetical protein AKJ51_04375 [candidate division MSBL1 archaeon SCGC-AAA382A20]
MELSPGGSNSRSSPSEGPLCQTEKADKTFEQSVEQFLEEFEKTMKVAWGLADSTIVDRMRCANRLVDFLNGHPLKASYGDILDFLEKYPAQGMYKGVRVIYGRFFDTDLAEDVKIPKYGAKHVYIPDKSEIREVFENLDCLDVKTAYLMWATSGLRRGELLNLTPDNVDFDKRMLVPGKRNSTKNTWVTFCSDEAAEYLDKLERLPGKYRKDHYLRKLKKASDGSVTPQILRKWFAKEMRNLNVSGDHVDAFCGRLPQSVRG